MKKKFAPAVTSVIGVSILLTGCNNYKDDIRVTKAVEKASDKQQILNLTIASEIPTMDVSKATDQVSATVMRNVFEGLYTLGEDNKPVPGVAESYDVSPDKTKYTFHLRDSKWSNGASVTAKDFVFAWQRAINPETAAEYAFLFFDIKNAKQVNEKELEPDQLGVKAIDDKTLEVQLNRPVPYFLSLTAFPTFLPINEEYFKSQGNQYALEANHLIYNGSFTLDNWRHEQSFQLSKNPNYWDNNTVKLEKINYNIVKDKSTEVNLYDSEQIDRVTLTAEFVDKYKGNQDFKERSEVAIQFLRLNQKNTILKNQNARLAISQALNRKAYVNTILNNGAIPAEGLIPTKFTKGPNGKDFREENSNLIKDDVKVAKENWKKAKQELNTNKITIELLTNDTDLSKKTGEYLKGELEKNLDGLTINLKSQPLKQQLKLLQSGDYEIGIDRWSPDFEDPITFLDLFTTDNAYNFDKYSNQEYDELIHKVKADLAGDEKARWEAMKHAEKILLKDAAVAPLFQSGRSYLQRAYVKGLITNDFGGEFNYKWASISK